MAKNEAKIKFTAETGEFNSAIQSANGEMSKLRAELQLNEAQMKNTGTSVEGLQQKHSLLEQQLTAAQSKTEALSGKVEAAARIFGENSTEVSKLQTQLTNAQTAEEKIRTAISQCNTQLEEQKSAAGGAETATQKLTGEIESQQTELDTLKGKYVDAVLQYGKNSSQAKELAGEIKNLSGELSDNKNKMDAAEGAADKLDRSIDGAGDAARNSGDGFTVMKGVVADLASEAIQLGIDKISEFVGWLSELPEATRELRQDMTTLETSFETAGFTTSQATETWKELYKVFGEDDRAVEASNLIAKMAGNQQDLNDWVTITTGVYGQYQDSLPVEGLAEAAMETSRTGEVTGVLADALNWSSEAAEMFAKYMGEDATNAEEAFNVALSECTTEQERQELITETLLALYGDSAAKYEEAAGSQLAAKEATADNTLAQAELAEAIEPVTTAWEGLKTQLIVAVTPAIESVCGWLQDAVTWLKDHPAVVGAVAAAVGVLAIGFTGLAVALGVYAVAQAIATAAATPFLIPIIAIIAAIALLAAGIVLVIAYWDEIMAWGVAAWEAIKSAWNAAGEWFSTNVVQPIVNFFTGLWDSISQGASSLWEGIKTAWSEFVTWVDTNLIQPVVNFFTGLWTSIVSIWNTICNAVQVAIMFIGEILSAAFQIITLPFMFIWENCKQYVFAAWEWIKSAVSTAITAVSTTISTVWNAIKTATSTAWNAIKTVFTNVWNSIKAFLSPIINSIKTAISNAWNSVKTTTTNVWNSIKTAISNVWNSIKTAVSTAINAVKTTVSNVFNSVKSTVTTIWNGIKTAIDTAWNNIKTGVSTAINGVKSTVSSVFNSVKSTVSSVWGEIKSAITTPIEEAKTAVKNAIDKIKGFFDFEWSLPKLKMPHFTISGSFSLNPPSVPSFGVEWYAKAMNAPMILNGATIFGTAGGKLLGGGEAGREMIGGVDTVASMIQNAVTRSMQTFNLSALADAIEDMASRPIEMNINGRQFALATASDGDSVNGLRSTFKSRGLIVD